MPHSAVLLAGGKSSRMGRDKAGLVVEGVPLWQRQLATLRATEPVELFISGREEALYAGSGVEVIADAWPDAGPLGGLASALRKCSAPWAVVLAVDMPAMTGDFLRSLLDEAAKEGAGMVPCREDGRWEPLAAVYPRAAWEVAESLLREGQRKMEEFVLELEKRGFIWGVEVEEAAMKLFDNWNTPGDVRADRFS